MSGIQDIVKSAGLKKETVEKVFEELVSRVAAGETVHIKGFGSFERRLNPGRTLVTPAVNNGKPIVYPDSYVLKFRSSQLAKRRLNVVAQKAGELPAPKANSDAKPAKPAKSAPPAKAAKTATAKAAAPVKAKPAKKPKPQPGQDQE